MCRNIKKLYDPEFSASQAEIQASAIQFVSKVSGIKKPRKEHQAAFDQAVYDITQATQQLFKDLVKNHLIQKHRI